MIPVDRILYQGRIYTQPHATALAIWGERILAVGQDHEILPLATANTRLENLNGRVVWPGLTDAHIHWEHTAKALQSVDLFQVPSKAEALARLHAGMDRLQAGEWLIGRGWFQELWLDNQQDFPTAANLDSFTGATPAYLTGKSGHVAWVNSAALRLAGITSATPDPDGAKIGRDEHGHPNGLLFEWGAMNLVAALIPKLSAERLAELMHDLQQHAWACGLTGIHDYDDPSCMVALQLLRERGNLGLRVVKHINQAFIESAYHVGLRTHFGDDWIRIGALKLFADGALGPRTALMIEPYDGEPDNYGVRVLDQETMVELASRASQLGLPTTIHAIGDRAVHEVLEVFEAVRAQEAQAGIPRAARRHRIEHVQIVHPDDMGRLGQLDIIAGMQPIHAASDWSMAERFWGGRTRYSYTWKSQLKAGAVLAFGSDSPIDHFDPRMGLFTAVTRRDMAGNPEGGWHPQECLSLAEALQAYTLGAAYAAGMEDRLGQLRAGFLADLIILDQDPFAQPAEALLELPIVGTMVGGQWRYQEFDT
jgi:hypothetical protein